MCPPTAELGLTHAQAQSAASLTDLGLHKLMERYRQRSAAPKPARRRRGRATAAAR